MAIRQIRLVPDEILRKKAKPVTEINERIVQLIDDMKETMIKADGIGLAAPQVGILKRIIMVQVEENYIELINPVILEESGDVLCLEGCLSIPDVVAYVRRPNMLKIQGLDRNGKVIAFKVTDMIAVALSHEVDHINGILFVDKRVDVSDEELEELRKENRVLEAVEDD